jgi:hypothetical protein
LYPNPAIDIINVVVSVDAPTTAEIYTINGHLVKTLRLVNNSTAIEISDLTTGVYLIKISSGYESAYKVFSKN